MPVLADSVFETRQLFGVPSDRTQRPLLCDGLLDLDAIGLLCPLLLYHTRAQGLHIFLRVLCGLKIFMRFKPPLPKEHGAWAMLAVPLLIGLAIAPAWRWSSLLAIVAVIGLFLVRYPLETLIKTKRRDSALIVWAIIYASPTLLCGGWLIVIDRLIWLIPIGLLGAAFMLFHFQLAARRQDMSALGELSGIAALALGAPIVYYAASGQLDGTALALWLINSLYFGGTVFYIKLKVRQQPRLPAPDRIGERLIAAKTCLTYQGVTLTLVVPMVALHSAPVLIVFAFVPMTIKVLYGAYRWQDKPSLRLPRLGLIELFHSVLFAVLVIAAFK